MWTGPAPTLLNFTSLGEKRDVFFRTLNLNIVCCNETNYYFCWPTYCGSNCWRTHGTTLHRTRSMFRLICFAVWSGIWAAFHKCEISNALWLRSSIFLTYSCAVHWKRVSTCLTEPPISSAVVIIWEQLQRLDGVEPAAVCCQVFINWLTVWRRACLHLTCNEARLSRKPSYVQRLTNH